jgi:hypothetical protein
VLVTYVKIAKSLSGLQSNPRGANRVRIPAPSLPISIIQLVAIRKFLPRKFTNTPTDIYAKSAVHVLFLVVVLR